MKLRSLIAQLILLFALQKQGLSASTDELLSCLKKASPTEWMMTLLSNNFHNNGSAGNHSATLELGGSSSIFFAFEKLKIGSSENDNNSFIIDSSFERVFSPSHYKIKGIYPLSNTSDNCNLNLHYELYSSDESNIQYELYCTSGLHEIDELNNRSPSSLITLKKFILPILFVMILFTNCMLNQEFNFKNFGFICNEVSDTLLIATLIQALLGANKCGDDTLIQIMLIISCFIGVPTFLYKFLMCFKNESNRGSLSIIAINITVGLFSTFAIPKYSSIFYFAFLILVGYFEKNQDCIRKGMVIPKKYHQIVVSINQITKVIAFFFIPSIFIYDKWILIIGVLSFLILKALVFVSHLQEYLNPDRDPDLRNPLLGNPNQRVSQQNWLVRWYRKKIDQKRKEKLKEDLDQIKRRQSLARLEHEISMAQIKIDDDKPEEKKKDEESKECVVCLVDTPTHAIVPCGHLCLCEECAKIFNLKVCPMCRSKFTSVVKIFK